MLIRKRLEVTIYDIKPVPGITEEQILDLLQKNETAPNGKMFSSLETYHAEVVESITASEEQWCLQIPDVINLEITQEDIDNSNDSTYSNPVSLALSRILKRNVCSIWSHWRKHWRLDRGGQETIKLLPQERSHYFIPDELGAFMQDYQDKKPVKPFSMNLKVIPFDYGDETWKALGEYR